MSKSSAINIAVTIDDKGSVTLRKIGDESKKTGEKGEKGFAKMRKGIADLDDSMTIAMPSFTQMAGYTFATTIAGIAGMVAGGTALIASAAAQAKEIGNLSRLANMGSVEFQNYAFATNSVGVSSEKLADISKDVQDKLGDFIATGGGEFKDFFEEVAPLVGLTADQLQGLSGPDVLIAVKDAMDQVNLSAEEQVFYLESLGNDASLLTPLLRDNGAALKEQAAQADALGLAISEIESEQLLEAGKAIKKMEGLAGSLKNKVAAELSPAFTDLAGKIINGMTEGRGGVDGLATSLSTYLLKGIGMVVETMRFFHNGWLGIKLVGTAAIDAISQGLVVLFDGLRTLMTPLDMLFEGAKKLGAIDVNPFDGVEEALGTFSASSRDVTNQVLAEIQSVNDSYDKAKGVVDGYTQDVIDRANTEKQQLKSLVTAHNTSNDAIEQSNTETSGELTDTWRSYYQGLEDANDRSVDDIIKAQEKTKAAALDLADKQSRAYRDMYNDMEHSAEEDFTHRVGLLDDLYETYKGLKVDQVKLDAWHAAEYKKLEDEKLLKTGDFFDGVRLGHEDLIKDQTTWAEAGKTIFTTFADESASALSSNLFDVIHGDLDNLGDVWGSLWNTMLQTMIDILAEMAVTWTASAVTKVVASYYHDGTMEIKRDEEPAILQKGEMIIPRDHAEDIRSNMSKVSGAMPESFDRISQLVENATNAQLDQASSTSTSTAPLAPSISGVSWITGSGGEEGATQQTAAQSSKPYEGYWQGGPSTISEGGSTASNTPGSVDAGLDFGFGATLADEALGKGIHAVADMLSGVSPNAVMGRLMNPLTAINMVAGAGATAVSGTAIGAMGFDTPAGSIGAGLGGLIGGFMGGPVGSALGGVAGAIAAESLADATDSRKHEDLLDVLEEHYGFFKNHEVLAKDNGFLSVQDFLDYVEAAPGGWDALGVGLEDEGRGVVNALNNDPYGMSDEAQAAGIEGVGSDMGNPGSDMGNIGDDPGEMAARYGGIFSGPDQGYPVELHGTEAIIPLRDGSVPVEISGADSFDTESGTANAELLAEIRKLVTEVMRGNFAIAKNTGQTARLIGRWDGDGMPEVRA